MSTPKKELRYENNPFFIAANGVTALIELARGVMLFLVGLSLFNYVRGIVTSDPDKTPQQQVNDVVASTVGMSPTEWIVAVGAIVLIVVAAVLVSGLFSGVSAYTAARLARGHKVGIREAFSAAFDNLLPYIWLQIIISIKLFLWSLLLVVPALIMAIRYSLAGAAFYDDKKKLRGNAAVKESLRLTKGAWITTFSSHMLVNFITFMIFSPLLTTAVNTTLYRQYSALSDKEKPAPHVLSWIVFGLPLAIALLALFAFMSVIGMIGFTAALEQLVK